ncbi:hypothetical protein QJS04_geneDACA007618 [Acorus gramineus]|uniref:RING-CH-type domain-containing protein n=1 Tax=Acorus gramineus TaxID=55184 RepID=A0AAV9B1Q1_ACOGR|nr:hypothetical protein QJS04_geneDACA007618 [Acorus gramineus]
MAMTGGKSHEDIEEGRAFHRQSSTVGGDDDSDDSLCFSDAEEQSWHSPFNSNGGRTSSYDEYRFSGTSDDPEIGREVADPHRSSCVSDCSVEMVESESGVMEIKVHATKVEKDCRICHMGLESGSQESGTPIELGCSCKEDLAVSHRQCAETWFKIKGNKICEICGVTAKNVIGTGEVELIEQLNETNSTAAPTQSMETRSFWHGHRFLNFLLACMVFAFVISWLFHFNVPG